MAADLTQSEALRVVEVRGQLIVLAADVAAAFAVETRQVVQNIKNNPMKLPPSAPGRSAARHDGAA